MPERPDDVVWPEGCRYLIRVDRLPEPRRPMLRQGGILTLSGIVGRTDRQSDERFLFKRR